MGITKTRKDVEKLNQIRAENRPRGRPPKTRIIEIFNIMDYIKKVDALQIEGNLAENWKTFKQSFEIFATAIEMDKKPDAVKVAILLNTIGTEALEIYNAMTLTENEKKDYKIILEKFEEFCKPKKNEVYESYRFHTRKQQHMESFDNFLMELKKLLKRCDFADPERMLRDRIVLGIQDKALQRRMLEMEKLTLEKAVEMARATEAASTQVTNIQGTTAPIQMIEKKMRKMRLGNIENQGKNGKNYRGNNYRLQQNKYYTKMNKNTQNHSNFREYNNINKYQPKERINIDCSYCNKTHKKACCPAYGATCNNCRGKNHFAVACKKKAVSDLQLIKQQDDTSSDETLYLDAVNHKNGETWYEKIKVKNIVIQFKLDTGAQVNVLPLKEANKVVGLEIINDNVNKLEAYNGSLIETIGKATLRCSAGNIIDTQEFYITKHNTTPILGLKGCIDLGLIKRINAIKLNSAEELIQRFKPAFTGIGCFYDYFRIELKENQQPVAKAPRRIPISLRKPVKEELDRLVEMQIIENVNEPSSWISNIVVVEKENKKIRICLDPKFLNLAIKDHYYEIPTFDQIKPLFANKKLFTVLDLKDGYWQIKLHTESKKLCTFSTPFGCYRFTRLPFGLKIAPEIFQKLNSDNFRDIPNVIVYIDDLIIAAANEEEHDKTLNMVLERAIEKNVKFNKAKIQFKVKEVKFMGQIISENGIRIDKERVKAIQNLTPPRNKKELQKLLGFINYVREYVPNLASLSSPLRELLKKGVEFQWLENHNQTLEKIKKFISEAPTLKSLDWNGPIAIQTDAAKNGLGCTMMQNNKPVAFASRSLTEAEENYAQVEKEFLAVVYACTKWHNLIYGRKVEIITDHKPLLGIINKEYNKIPSARLQRMKLRLEKYDLKFTYMPGKYLYIADLLSRNTDMTESPGSETKGLKELIHSINVSDARKKQFQEETEQDETLKDLKKVIIEGWPNNKKSLPEKLKYYWKHKNDLIVDNNIIFLNDRIVVPYKMRAELLNCLHTAHLGIEKTKSRARTLIYWPGINEQIEQLVTSCSTCQKYRSANANEPLLNHDIPECAFNKIGIDIMETAGQSYLVVADYYSKYLEICPLVKKTAKAVIGKLETMFATFGIPITIICDNMPFSSLEFRNFARINDIQVITSSPNYPKSNGLAEKYVQIAKRLIEKTKENNTDLWLALLEYRNTPIKNSMISPVELMMGRKTRTRIPGLTKLYKDSKYNNNIIPILKKNNANNKKYYDLRAKERDPFEEGEQVWIKSKNDEPWVPGKVLEKHSTPRSYMVKTEDGGIYRRNAIHIRKRNQC